jgi:hypothetical protein
MCTIHADSSEGVFRRVASYAVQAPERLPLESSNLLIAGSVHFVVHLDSEAYDSEAYDAEALFDTRHSARSPNDRDDPDAHDPYDPYDPAGTSGVHYFPAVLSRQRFVSSIREVVDAEGAQVVSNEVYRPGPDRRAEQSSPLRQRTLEELRRFGYEPRVADAFGFRQ